jgi:L-iditol 2-dehydrogenase
MGHEAAGTVAAVGPGVASVREGDRVAPDSTVYCGECEYCRRGEINLCNRREVLGVSTADFRRAGAFAEFVTIPERIVHRLPETLPFTEAAMIEPLAVAVHAVDLAAVPKNGTALVVGAGMIGLLTLQALRVAGCSAVYVLDIEESRLKLAEELGATAVINAKTADPAAELSRLTDGAGVDVAMEAVGSTATIKTAIENVRKGGTVVLIGNIAPMAEIPLQVVVSRQLRLQGSAASAGEYPRCIELLSRGKINLKPLISMVAPLEEGPQWFERLHSKQANLMKVILTPASRLAVRRLLNVRGSASIRRRRRHGILPHPAPRRSELRNPSYRPVRDRRVFRATRFVSTGSRPSQAAGHPAP